VESYHSAYNAGWFQLSPPFNFISNKNLCFLIHQVFREDPRVKPRIVEMERQVEQGVITAGQAAEVLLHYFVPGTKVMP
jgi:hypothetical protein